MGRLVTIKAGKRGVSLPNNQTYDAGESVILTDEEWEKISPNAIGTLLVDGGATAAGPEGTAGVSGKSAYDIAVDHGFTGTQADWLASLAGPPGASATSVQVLINNQALGTQAAAQTGFTYYAVNNVAQRGLVSRFVITPSDVGAYDIEVRATNNGTGERFLYATGASSVYDMSVPFHFENATNSTFYVGIRNAAAISLTFTLTTLRVERYA